MNELLEKGRSLYAYDILKLAHFGIGDPLDEEDFKEAYDFLKESMSYTKDHKNHVFEF